MYRSHFCRLLVDRPEGGDDTSLCMVRNNAEALGLTNAFPEWSPRPLDPNRPGVVRLSLYKGGRNGRQGGKRLRLSRSPSKMGWPTGLTHCFRIIGPCSKLKLCKVAAAIEIDWHWMETEWFERLDKECWLKIYDAHDEAA
jgi:hypothetical protein